MFVFMFVGEVRRMEEVALAKEVEIQLIEVEVEINMLMVDQVW